MSGGPGPGGDGPSRGKSAEPTRRLTLSPIGFDIVLALSQAPNGLRLADVAHVIASPVSSVQTALRILLANGIVERLTTDPPTYRLEAMHPARSELVSLAAVLPAPERSIGIALRSNPAVVWAGVDAAGFLVALDDDRAEATAALQHHLDLVASARPESPPILRMPETELRRMARVSLDLRARVRDAVAVRGSSTGLIGTASSGRCAG